MEKEQKLTLGRILLAALLLLILHFVPVTGWGRLALYLIPYLTVGFEVLKEAAEGIAHGEVFDEDFLMAVATIGALALGEYAEAVFVMLFFCLGELFEDLAVDRSRASIASLLELCPQTVFVEREGMLAELPPEKITVGETLLVKPGERLALDGEILSGESSLDTAALTGESLPRAVAPGDAVLSGCVNLTGALRVRVTKLSSESAVTKILETVENASQGKARSESFIARFAHWYTPAVVVGALLLALVPPLFTGQWSVWVHRALTFLVISCPCALVISVPLTFFGGVGGASRRGILVKSSGDLEALASVRTVVFDKTGTLTEGRFSVSRIFAEENEAELLELAALAESCSTHPMAAALREAFGKSSDLSRVESAEELAGFGVRAVVDGRTVLAGNAKLMEKHGIVCRSREGTAVHVAADGKYLGCLVLEDALKPSSVQAVRSLREQGVRKTVLLTGDSRQAAEKTAAAVGADAFDAELLPDGKVRAVEALLSELRGEEKLAFVGDGINDAPVLARADVGVAMGAFGSDAAIEAADVVLMDDDPAKLPLAVAIAGKTLRIVRENIAFAVSVKLIVLLLGALGIAGLGWAVFADVGVMVLAVANAARALRAPKA